MKNFQKILVGAAVAAVLVCSVAMLARKPVVYQPSSVPSVPSTPSVDTIDASKIIFDAKTTIPETGVTFAYPSNGFYGDGLTLTKSDRSPLQILQNVANYYLESRHQQVSLNVYELRQEKTLEDAVTTIVNSGQVDENQRNLGHYQTVNGTRFFLFSSSDPRVLSNYNAYAVIKGRLLAVTFDGGFTVSDPGTAPDLVTLFLNHMDFTCASDCSVNSAPIVEFHMPTEGQQ